MAKMTIYVPDAVKERLDAVKDSANWSEVAVRAFEIKIGELAAAKKERDMTSVIERLRASKLSHAGEAHQLGHEVGREWAEAEAEYVHLKRLAEFDERQRNHERQGGKPCEGNEVAREMLGGEDEVSWDDAEAFWEQITGGGGKLDINDPAFVLGFRDGALEVFTEVQDRI